MKIITSGYSTIISVTADYKKDYAAMLRNRIFAFGNETGSNATMHLTFITTFGIKQNAYSNMVQSEILLDDLFNAPMRK